MDKENVKDKLGKAAELLDVQRDLERTLPGPSEQERNESRLRSVITGEARPAEHVNHEAKAFAHANATIPLLLGFLRFARLGGKAMKGAKAIDKSSKLVHPAGLQGKVRPAQKMAKEGVEVTGKTLTEAKKEAPKKLFERFMYTVNGGASDETWAHRIAKEEARNIDTAAKFIDKSPTGKTEDVINTIGEEAGKSAEKALGGTVLATKAGKAVSDNVGKKKKYDGDLELNRFQNIMNIVNGIASESPWDPERYPMEQINQLLLMTNGDVDVWDEDSLNELSDEAKIKLVIDTMHGKYNDYGDVSNAMLKNYLKMTNKDEVHE
jgi:hypothetical protein